MTNVVPRPGVRRREATRERMLEAARSVLAREGIQGASVEHICEQAGFTRGAFYSNFSSKDDLLLALFDRERELMIARLRESADPASLADKGVVEAFTVILDRFLVLQPQDREWFLVHAEFQLRGVRHDAVGRAFVQSWHQVRHDFEEFMASVLERMGLRLTVPAAHVAGILIGTYDDALRTALMEERPLDLELLRTTLPTVLLSVVEPA
jgi:AcrR family transcriptional regulator